MGKAWQEPSSTWCLMESFVNTWQMFGWNTKKPCPLAIPLMVEALSPIVYEGRGLLESSLGCRQLAIGSMLLCEGQTIPGRILALRSNLNVKLKSSEFIKGFRWGWDIQ